ncbi:LADA_0G06106g1_1 [Lachancea dasiensis]|uniref:LADA_0G06106g1_1 n=1 Tax=Lachancea dasiensis TaxID=1072105 RepID=A0A1G4JT83_9SACH|nr:LADA_0G06106g1_1 [Lachancea dasiensis]
MEDCKQETNSADDGIETTGAISVRDFAYDKSTALHFGFYGDNCDEDEESTSHADKDDVPYRQRHNQNIDLRYPNCGSETADTLDGNYDENPDDSITKRQSIIMPNDYIVNKHAVALYDFVPENDNELELHEGDTVLIGYRHGQGWLVAENEEGTRTGLVPEEYVTLTEAYEESDDNDGRPRPFYLTQMLAQSMNDSAKAGDTDAEWEDIDDLETDFNENMKVSEA